MASEPHVPGLVFASKGDVEVALLDPTDVQQSLKLSSRRAARDLIVREMEHVVVGRTPKTTNRWLAEWLERQRRSPRRPTPQNRRAGGTDCLYKRSQITQLAPCAYAASPPPDECFMSTRPPQRTSPNALPLHE